MHRIAALYPRLRFGRLDFRFRNRSERSRRREHRRTGHSRFGDHHALRTRRPEHDAGRGDHDDSKGGNADQQDLPIPLLFRRLRRIVIVDFKPLPFRLPLVRLRARGGRLFVATIFVAVRGRLGLLERSEEPRDRFLQAAFGVGVIVAVLRVFIARAFNAFARQADRRVVNDRVAKFAVVLGGTAANFYLHIHDRLLHWSHQHAKLSREDRREKTGGRCAAGFRSLRAGRGYFAMTSLRNITPTPTLASR
ncbi:hypothetical protein [Rhodoblastus acidophilus]|uniref:hypothetical protein n=1 Tax=Rhodoblastus acidophilus TaxID=1074 RepID=UPI002224FC22|nr:hypothetical protein [Rhodoblastus acidophilus]